ncbi:alpha/beta hydrolase [Bailinhaonella thermotolerans]|uniref:Alpha/beta hydrolase n=1 Tax=Bailinhaonella thermotolerans TaxID=1070861 RepID=A0A3A4ARI0_9ACTN|nr:alpha/beta hydrolase [Bailinhaonella thermotolerans]RJL32458.1 alpha/beta hydrolase [Bailinhaonella thermotolerans]
MRDPREVLTRPAPPPDLTVAYGAHPDQVIDVRLPPASPRAVVVMLHGGFWRPEYDRAHTAPMTSALAAEGYVACTPEYRRSGWPETLDDVAAALDALPGLLAAVWPGDGSPAGPPVVLAGHSAGGQLALWSAARHRLPAPRWRREEPPPVTGVLALAPVCDLGRASRLRLDGDAVDAFLGGSPHVHPPRYAAADPARLRPYDLPVVILHGDLDVQVPVTLSRDFARAGRDVTLRELRGVEHYGLIDPLSEAWPRVLSAVAELARRGPAGEPVR